jgi:ATP-binding cassette subfamily F protein 3
MARYVFADLMLQKPNFLVLDEPTNHLDIEGIEALEDALAEYKGTVLMVSHDRAFIKRVCNRVFELKNGTLHELMGGVSALDIFEDEADKPVPTARQKTEAAMAAETVTAQKELSYEERKRLKSEAGKMQTRIRKLEEEIARFETEIRDLDALFADGSQLQALGTEQLRLKTEERTVKQKALEERMAEWEKLSAAGA